MIDFRSFFREHRRLVSGLGLLLAVALIFWAVSSPAIVGVSASKRSLPVYSVERSDKRLAISFDAAWGNEDTQTLIDILNRYGVRATFFVVGDWAEKYPESVKALAEAGNEVMNHSSSHAHFSSLSSQQIREDLSACNEKISALTGVTPSLFRCPYGEYDDHVIQTVEAMGMTAVQWDVDSLDWKGITSEEISRRVLQNVGPGSIVLFHNAAIVPISELLLQGDTRIDNTGRQWQK